MRDLRKRLAALSPQQRELFRLRLRQDPGLFNVFPLSSAQKRIWFVERFGSAGHAFHGAVVIRIEGILDEAVVRRTVAAIVRRHESLRTTFLPIGDSPMQIVWSVEQFGDVDVPVGDASTPQPDRAPDQVVDDLLREEMRKPFDLARGPVFRTRLFRIRTAEAILMLTVHHIAFDEMSAAIVLREFAQLYTAFAQGREDPLPPLRTQYPDFAAWQQQQLAGDRFNAAIDYWRRQLNGAPVALDLPTDRPRPEVLSYEGASVEFFLSGTFGERLIALGRAEGATLFMVMLAAFSWLLRLHSGQTDIVVGTSMSGRDRPELEQLIGVFLNLLALRVDASGEPSFRQLLCRVRQTTLSAFAHRDLPFEKVVETVNPERELGRSPLFQALLVFWTSRPSRLSVPGAVLRSMRVSTGTTQHDLAMLFDPEPDHLRGELRYNPRLFSVDTARRLVTDFESLLQAVLDAPDRPISCPPEPAIGSAQSHVIDPARR
jgi:hypothetical protein